MTISSVHAPTWWIRRVVKRTDLRPPDGAAEAVVLAIDEDGELPVAWIRYVEPELRQRDSVPLRFLIDVETGVKG